MTEFYFYVTEDAVNEMEAEDYEAFERAQDGDFKLYRIRPAIARFMVDINNVPIPYNIALKASGKMKLKKVKDFITKFFDVMKQRAIPNASGSQSKLPSEAISADSLSPLGSQR